MTYLENRKKEVLEKFQSRNLKAQNIINSAVIGIHLEKYFEKNIIKLVRERIE